ncbi:MAG: hypothetical protein ABII71_01940 [Candidatus Micrarchaeota archaeon]
MDDNFHDVQDDAKKLEKKALEYKPYTGDVRVEMAVDLSPQEYIDMNYRDLLNLFERTEKIRSAAKLDIYGAEAMAAEKTPIPAANETEKSEEVESRLKEMSTESVEMAEKIGVEMRKDQKNAAEGKPEAARPPEVERPKSQGIEFETIPAEERERAGKKPKEGMAAEEEGPEAIEFETLERKEHPEIELETPEKEEEPKKPEAAEPRAEQKIEKKMVIAIPPILQEDPDEAASRKFEEIEGTVKGALGENVNETELKKKMLELTKQLFKEKSVNRREEIKAEIAILKNMLGGKAVKGTAAKGKKVTDTMANAQVLDSLVKSQESEIASTKDKITGPFREQLNTAKARFYESMKGLSDEKEKKERYEALVFTLTSLSEQIPNIVEKYEDFLMKKHMAELKRLQESLGTKDTKTASTAGKRMNEIESSYPEELSSIRNIVTKEIDNVIEAAGREVFVEKDEKKEEEIETKPKKEDKATQDQDRIFEINEMDEGTLLFYLHSKDRDYYKKYERRNVGKAEALLKAKALMAKEKGLSDDMIRKYFSESEG